MYVYIIIFRLNPPPKRIVEAGGTLKSFLIEDRKEDSKENLKNNEVLNFLNSDSRDLRPDTGNTDDNPDKFSNSVKSGIDIFVCVCVCMRVCVYIYIYVCICISVFA